MRSLPLTNKARPGGRPRESRAPANAFGTWLLTCGMTPEDVALKLKVSESSVYNARNGYFKPGLELALAIEKLSDGKVPAESWVAVKTRPRHPPAQSARRGPRKRKAA